MLLAAAGHREPGAGRDDCAQVRERWSQK